MQEPTLERYHGDTLNNRLQTWLAATRPAFFTASVLPILVGLALTKNLGYTLHIGLAALTILANVLIHAAANVLNDYFDARNGTDARNQERIFPFTGGSRFIQNEILSSQATLWLGLSLLGAGIVLGLYLVWASGLGLLWIGLAGAFLAVFYSAPPVCLACRGLGDFAIALSFGVLPLLGTLWVQLQPAQLADLPAAAWWLGLVVGLFASAILWINSIPDIKADQASGKYTLPVRLGPEQAPFGLALLFGAGFAILLLVPLPSGSLLATLGLVPAIKASRNLLKGQLMPAIPQTLITHTSVCLLLAVGLAFL